MAKIVSKKAAAPEDPIVGELSDIKRLMILALLRNGATQGEIATALGVNQSSISRMFPGGLGKPKSKG